MKAIVNPRRDRYLAKFAILLIIVALIAGIVVCGCNGEEKEKIPIYITDWDDLNTNRDKLGADYVWILENDLDSTTPGYTELASPTANAGKGWEPIGAEGNPFKGTFYGGNNTISDLYIDRPDEDEVGLFGRVQGSDQGGVIKNLGLEAVNVTGKKSVGALVGYNWKGTLDSDTRPPGSKTYSSGIVTGEEDVGGLVGNNFDGTVNQCESTADVLICVAPGEKRWRAGGLVGLNSGPVLNCNYNGEVNGDRQVGGLVGLNERTLTEVGRVEDCGGAYSVNGTRICGGVAGQNMGALRRNSYCCWVNGNYTEIGGGLTTLNEGAAGNADSYDTALPGEYIGGVVGWNGPDGTVDDCSAQATVVGYRYVAGVAGKNDGYVTGCNSSGYVTGNLDVGRFAGYNTGTLTNPESTSCVTGAIDCGPLVGRNEGVIRYDLTVSSTSGGSVTTPGEGTFTYEEGEVVNLVAEAEEGYHFVKWTGDVGTIANVGDATTTITMNDNYSITATFVAEQIRIGGIFDLTGELAAMSDLISKGAILAVEEINAEGGVLGRDLELLIEDGGHSDTTGFNAYKKLVEVNGVQVIVGPMISEAVMSSGAYAQDMQVPMVSPSSTSALVHIQPWTDWAFRTCAADHAQATVLAQIIIEEGYQTAAILVADTMFGIGYELVVTEILEDAGVEIVESIRYDESKLDYLTELNAIKDANPDVITLYGYSGYSAAIFEQAAAVGLDTTPWLVFEGVYGLEAETYPAAAAFMAEANLLGCTLADEEALAYAAFEAAYEARWGESPGVYCDTVYDAVNLIALAIEETGEYDGAAIKEALYEVGVDYSGVSGTITWDETGDRVGVTYGIWELVYDEEKDEYEYVILYNVEF